MPLASTELPDRANAAISLPERGRRLRGELGAASRWHQHSHHSPFTSLMGSFVNGLGVVRAVCRKGLDGVIKLLKQGRDQSAVMRSASGQIRRDDPPASTLIPVTALALESLEFEVDAVAVVR